MEGGKSGGRAGERTRAWDLFRGLVNILTDDRGREEEKMVEVAGEGRRRLMAGACRDGLGGPWHAPPCVE